MKKIHNRLALRFKICWPIAFIIALPVPFGALATAADEQNSGPQANSESQQSQTLNRDTESNVEQARDRTNIERIQVYGRRWLPQTTSAQGSFTLNREFLDNALKGNGNITDMLLFLPGVQGSESALSASEQAEIRSQLLSISGAQPWHTAFMLDGVNNNSYLDPGSSGRSPTAINDVQGHPEATFVNQELVGSVTLYDSNIPARYGAFNGGVVDMQLREPRLSPSFTLNYRRSHSDWGSYHLLDLREYNEDAEAEALDVDWPEQPNFDKESLSFSASREISDNQAVTVSVARTTSTITDISLQDAVQTKRESISTAITYQLDDIVFDRIRLNAGYSPYTGRHIITNVRDSEFDLEGGGAKLSLKLENELWDGDWSALFSWSQSENSRTAPNLFLPWIRAQGKSWGIDSGQPPLSVEGGYGDLDKTQTSWSMNTDYQRFLGEWLGALHSVDVGVSATQLDLQRERPNTAATYSSAWRDANIQCNGQTIDCVEQTYQIPLAELEVMLGGSIDFSNPEHVQAYADNLITRGQFFRYRRLYLAEDIAVSLQKASVYGEYSLDWPRLKLTLGFRADHDDFLENLNVAYRSRIGFDVFGNDSTVIVAGLNRYYAANLITYKLREEQRPYITQYRTLSGGVVGPWVTSSSAPRFRYRFDDVRTPYSDEATLGINQYLGHNAIVSLNYVQRRGYDQITRGPQQVIDGLTYLFQTNEGSNQHDRISLSYNQAWDRHALTFNVSYTENESSAESYDGTVVGVPEDELVVVRSLNDQLQLLSFDDLTRRQMDFSRPVTANLVWNARWFENFSSTLTASYMGKFDSIIDTGLLYEFERDGALICENCDINALTYPLFREYERPERLAFDGRFEYRLTLANELSAAINFEVSNLLNERTYLVSPGTAGIEVGREFWLGVNIAW
ncbi:hypothetical protein CWE08_03405 [Aliidiomarina iranensis]|uniref:Uncharacterized protein n=1 Tax=Aliidiomarina iranensis TaxID=1434071 RepID=A0A432VZT3_9GAMM|nr:TonB-dependent receptor plug domain-containing protein [Aliidiomarina iranensis]RUO22248.1 hypothetical protein CWE08_03405 [Aliidiomarina iranensis]